MRLWRCVAVVVLLCGVFAFRSDKIELETKALFGSRVELKIPKGFAIMSEEMAKLKCASERRPTLIYTNESGAISVTLNLTSDRATQARLPEIKGNLMHTFRQRYMLAKMKFDNLKQVNGRQVGFMEFSNPGIEYNLIFFTDLNGQLLICTVKSIDENTAQWQLAAQEIMASLKISN